MSDPFGAKSAKKAAKEQGIANELTVKQQNLQAAQQRRQSVREARIALGESRNAAANQGASLTSAAQGGIGGLKSQFTSNLSFLDNQNLIVDQTSAAIGRQRKYEAKAKRSKALWNLGLQVVTTGAKAAIGG